MLFSKPTQTTENNKTIKKIYENLTKDQTQNPLKRNEKQNVCMCVCTGAKKFPNGVR